MATDPLPLPTIGSLDELIDRAQRGVAAGQGLDAVKERLTARRDDIYRKMLNAPDDKVLGLRADLKAIEQLAQALLVQEVQGDLAYRAILQSGVVPEKPLTVNRVPRKRRPSPRDKTAQ